jgi:cbb3-type cytochrome oxidase cytochrome c subunit
VNNGPLLFLGILAGLASSFWALLLAPQTQIGNQQPVLIETTGELYPGGRPGLAQQGAEVYRSLGCVECHTQQTRQTGVDFEVWLADAGTNRTELAATLSRLNVPAAEATRAIEDAPARLLGGLAQADAQHAAGQITNGDAHAQVVLHTLGPDIQRKWGQRATVTQDLLRDDPVLIGNLRVGPDLANYGERQAVPALILTHLYNPKLTAGAQSKSMMPPYRFLFNRRKLAEGEKATLPVEPGYEVTPKPEAEALVAYLMSLRADAPLPEAPVPSPPTKALPAATNATGVASVPVP